MLSADRPAYKVGPGFMSGNVHFKRAAHHSVSFMLITCSPSRSLEFQSAWPMGPASNEIVGTEYLLSPTGWQYFIAMSTTTC